MSSSVTHGGFVRRALLDRLPACSELPHDLAPVLVSMLDFAVQLHRGAEELAALRKRERQ